MNTVTASFMITTTTTMIMFYAMDWACKFHVRYVKDSWLFVVGRSQTLGRLILFCIS